VPGAGREKQAKHARPDRVAVRLTFDETTTRLTVEDAGSPAPAGAGPDRPGFGLTGMRERAELLGGTLEASRTAGGFRVDLVVPG
jgi:signal transduction histidine kinase